MAVPVELCWYPPPFSEFALLQKNPPRSGFGNWCQTDGSFLWILHKPDPKYPTSHIPSTTCVLFCPAKSYQLTNLLFCPLTQSLKNACLYIGPRSLKWHVVMLNYFPSKLYNLNIQLRRLDSSCSSKQRTAWSMNGQTQAGTVPLVIKLQRLPQCTRPWLSSVKSATIRALISFAGC